MEKITRSFQVRKNTDIRMRQYYSMYKILIERGKINREPTWDGFFNWLLDIAKKELDKLHNGNVIL